MAVIVFENGWYADLCVEEGPDNGLHPEGLTLAGWNGHVEDGIYVQWFMHDPCYDVSFVLSEQGP